MGPLGGRGAAGVGGGGKWFYPVISLLQPVFVFFVVISSVFCHFSKAMCLAGIGILP